MNIIGYDIGRYIRDKRLEHGMTQEQACDGICSPITLSRMENGEQALDAKKIKAIMARIGEESNSFVAQYLSMYGEEEEYIDLINSAVKAILAADSKALSRLHDCYNKIKDDPMYDDDLALQVKQLISCHMLYFSKVFEGVETSWPEIGDKILSAIKITIPRFEATNIKNVYLTAVESYLLSLYGIVWLQYDKKKAVELLSTMKSSMDDRGMGNAIKIQYICLTRNYIIALKENGRFEECVETCDSFIDNCAKIHVLLFPQAMLSKLYSLRKLGREYDYVHGLNQAYWILDSLEENPVLKAEIVAFARAEFGVEF